MSALLRVSRVNGREGAQYISPDVQRDAIEGWAKFKGVRIAAWHVDEDWSGGAENRPGLEAAIARCESGETGGVVSWKINRFSRKTTAGVRDLERLEAKNARLSFVHDEVDTAGPMGRHVYRMMLSQAEFELDTIRDNWSTAQQRALERGAFVGRTPFGYVNITDKLDPRVGCLNVDPKWGPVVKKAFKIAAAEGIHAAGKYLRQVTTGKRWSTSDLRKLFRNKAYLGYSWIGSEGKGTLQVNKEAHKPLTTLATWTAAQTEPKHRRTNGDYPLSGIARCGKCGGSMTGSLQTVHDRKYRRMICSSSTNGGTSSTGHAAIVADRLEEYVREIIGTMLGDQEFMVRYVPGDVEAAREAMEKAEAELTAFANDTTLREILGAKYHDGAKERRAALDAAEAVYQELASQKAISTDLPAADELDQPEKFAAALRAMVDSIKVTPGRGPIEKRVRIRWVKPDATEQALAA
jgi:site-specific DNA recombinase